MTFVQTKPCPNCGELMGRNRGVCASCGKMTLWFKIRLIVGGISVIFALIVLAIMSYLAIVAENARLGAP
ncbi:MAG: hypothetical protein HYV27_09360 [Candidatus Hydrogenedentes bacterium]|nr:hypothetical protein [Candidatus Hydrogenedentota bacterium]